MATTADILGLIGVALTVLAYFLLHWGTFKSENLAFAAMNAVGSALILYSLIVAWNLSAFVMEACWFVISIYGIVKSLLNMKLLD
jgi:paired small multidrug resistance pump